ADIGLGRLFYAASPQGGVDVIYRTNGTAVGEIGLSINGAPAVFSDSDQFSSIQTSEWTFFAVTYDGTSGEVKFYSGTKSSRLRMSSASFDKNPGVITSNSTPIIVGNTAINGSRPFQGWLDKISFHGSSKNTSGNLT
ncbi:hypothetical protein RZS08_35150, partial [Arthrospira platensis SPKY1]|nr:hypothetical protein [Arthrospira platensis SPKY1]